MAAEPDPRPEVASRTALSGSTGTEDTGAGVGPADSRAHIRDVACNLCFSGDRLSLLPTRKAVLRRSARSIDTPDGFRPGATPVVVLAHGAGNDLRSAFLEYFAAALSERGLAVVRFNFPYKEAPGQRPPDRMPVLVETYREVVSASREAHGLAARTALRRRQEPRRARRAPPLRGEARQALGARLPRLPAPRAGQARRAAARSTCRRSDARCSSSRARATRSARSTRSARERKRLKLAGSLHVVEGGDHSFALPSSQLVRQSAEMEGAADAVDWFVRKCLTPKEPPREA